MFKLIGGLGVDLVLISWHLFGQTRKWNSKLFLCKVIDRGRWFSSELYFIQLVLYNDAGLTRVDSFEVIVV